jgi:DNA repair protein RecN (Recombination protein N)
MPGEDSALETERLVLHNADRLMRLSTEAYAALYEGDDAALVRLGAMWKRVADLAALDPRFLPYLEQRDAIKSTLEDLAFVLRDYSTHLDDSPSRLQAVEDRLAALVRLKRKFGPTLDDVLARAAVLRDELAELSASEARVTELAAAAERGRARFLELAGELSERRRSAAQTLSRRLEASLSGLAMPHARVEIRVRRTLRPDDWARTGIDEVGIDLSPNPGEELRPLARIASGGELSRVMLALHDLVRTGPSERTLVFDEIDSGIGGAVGTVVGRRLRKLGTQNQVLCITHLATVAAYADAHFVITKHVGEGRTSTRVQKLDVAGRQQEIARMIAGAAVSDQARAAATELLSAARSESEHNSKGESLSGGATGERSPSAKAKGRR